MEQQCIDKQCDDQQQQIQNNPKNANIKNVKYDNQHEYIDPYIPLEQKTDIEIIVCEPTLRDEGLSDYIQYKIKGRDQIGEFEVQRRFREFYDLHKYLSHLWPGCYIPPLPEKTQNNKDWDTILQRTKCFNGFCIKIANCEFLYNSQYFQSFLRCKDADCRKEFEIISKPSTIQLIQQFGTYFKDLQGLEIDADTNIKIIQFGSFLKKSQVCLEQFNDVCKQLAQQEIKIQQNLAALCDLFLPDFEKQLISQFTDDESLYVFNQPNQLDNKLIRQRQLMIENSKKGFSFFQYLQDYMTYEQLECKAYLDALECKEYYEKLKQSNTKKLQEINENISELKANKTSLKAMFKSGTKEEQVLHYQQKEQELLKEEEHLQILNDIITAVFGLIYIGKYKKEKNIFYRNIMELVANGQLQKNQEFMELWESINDETQTKINKFNSQ